MSLILIIFIYDLYIRCYRKTLLKMYKRMVKYINIIDNR